jgi:hypothetical protein
MGVGDGGKFVCIVEDVISATSKNKNKYTKVMLKDEMGGFMAMLHPNETVVNHTRGQGIGSTSVVYNIDARNADAGLAERLPQILRQHAAGVKASIMADVNRGGSAARTFGRA